MNLLMFFLMTTTSIMFFFMNNTLSMGLTLLIQTILLSLFLGSMIKSFWYLYMLILVYVGGMLVLFIYVTSIFPNNKFEFNIKSLLMMVMMLLVFYFLLYMINYFFNFSFPFNGFIINFNNETPLMNFFSMKMFHFKTNLIMIFLVVYLFYCMIVVIKITSFMNGPLRKLN